MRLLRLLKFHATILTMFALFSWNDGGTEGGDPPASRSDQGDATAKAIADAAAAAAARAKAETEAAVAEQLGMTPAEAKAALEAKEAADKAAMTEAERMQTEAAEKIAKAEADAKAAAAALHAANVTAALAAAGVNDNPSQLVPLVASNPGDTAEQIAEAVKSLQTARPALFTEAAPADHSIGGLGSGRSKEGDTRTAHERAKERAEQLNKRHGRGTLRAVQ